MAGIAVIQDCIVEDGRENGIVVEPKGKATISGTKVRRNAMDGMLVRGEAAIKDSSVTATGASWRPLP